MMLFPQEMKLHFHLGSLGTHLLCGHRRNVTLAAPPHSCSVQLWFRHSKWQWLLQGWKPGKAQAVAGSRRTSEIKLQSPWDHQVAGGQDETQQQGKAQNWGRHLETEESSWMGSSCGETREVAGVDFTHGFLQFSLFPFSHPDTN